LQNPGELRSTGGWISSYAILGIEGGQIRELDVDDVYNLDGELKNQQKFFKPVQNMQDALDVENVALSLSNWDPHFPNTAKNASFFVKEAGKAHKIDGVITIDVFLLQDLLDKWGGMYIPGEADLITSQNIYEKIFLMHGNFTPGESQKATFLANLADEVLRKILSADFEENKNIFEIFLNALDQKNMLLYFTNNDAQSYFAKQNWAGEIFKERYANAPFSVEWNWGANKSNLYLEREKRIKVEILNQNDIRYTYSLILKNNSISNTYPHGEYKNYLRIYLPENAEVTAVNGFGETEYKTSYERGFRILEGWFDIPIKSTKEINITYILENTEGILNIENDNISMPVNIFKQPGTRIDDVVRVEILYPESWTVTNQDIFDKARIQLVKEFELNAEKSFLFEWTLR